MLQPSNATTRIVAHLDVVQQRERAVLQLERGALGGAHPLRDLEEPQPDRPVGSEHVTRRDAEEQRVADLPAGAGDRDGRGLCSPCPEPIAVSRLLAGKGCPGYRERMTFNDNASVGGNTARRRGGGIAVAGGGVAGIGALAVLLLNLFTGSDFSGLIPVDQGRRRRVRDRELRDRCRREPERRLPAGCGIPRHRPVLGRACRGLPRSRSSSSSTRATSTQCGTASNQTGPFYCPPEETVYVDPTFFALLRERFDATAGPLAQLYVLAHEYGHHVQNITGIMRGSTPTTARVPTATACAPSCRPTASRARGSAT